MGNCEYLGSRPGIFKVLTIIFGGASIGLAIHAHLESYYIWKVKEEIFIASTVIVAGVSCLYLLLHLLSNNVALSKVNRMIDFIYHILASILLIIIGGIMIDATIEINNKICRNFYVWPLPIPCQLYEEKLTAGVLAVVNGITYGITAGLIISAAD